MQFRLKPLQHKSAGQLEIARLQLLLQCVQESRQQFADFLGAARQSLLASPDEDGHDDESGYGLGQPEAALLQLQDPPPVIKGGSGCDCGDDKGGAAFVGAAFVLLRRRRRR